MADVVLGKAYPSGKLASTWAKWEDYCQVGDFAQPDDTHYTEGVYVGYRYFDSVGKEPCSPLAMAWATPPSPWASPRPPWRAPR